MSQMKTIVAEEPGGTKVLRYVESERPSPGEGEVLIEAKAAGVNYDEEPGPRGVPTRRAYHGNK